VTLYHGSNLEIKNVDLMKCRPYKDFGRGFYLTSLKEQAEIWAKRMSRIYSGKPWITVFEFDEAALFEKKVAVKIFPSPNLEWAIFVLNNRNRDFTDFVDTNSNHDNKYDIVIGAVADDDIALQLTLFKNGVINLDTLVMNIEYRKLNDQYSFHTEKALSFLKKTGAWCYE
jgi:hypothetical protein